MHYVSVLLLKGTRPENLVYGSSADLTAMCESLVIRAYLYINSFWCILCYFYTLLDIRVSLTRLTGGSCCKNTAAAKVFNFYHKGELLFLLLLLLLI